MKKVRWISGMLLCCVLFSSCGLMDRLGFDTYDYMSEAVVLTHGTDGTTAEMLKELLEVLVLDSTKLTTFEKMSDAIPAYRDAVLSYMLNREYAKYSGNTALIEKAAKAYPEYHITQIVPEKEFETTMYRCFGGNVMINHKDGSRFKYLSKVGAYISPVNTETGNFHVEINDIGETPKTYRVRFTVVGENIVSDEYFALVIKRDDNTHYIKKLLYSRDIPG